MKKTDDLADWLYQLPDLPRASLVQLPTPIHRLANLGARLGGPELRIKRDDLIGLAGGGNKSRKLEFLVGNALRSGADTLVMVGAIQSNHTRQTAAAARSGLRCALLHCAWTRSTKARRFADCSTSPTKDGSKPEAGSFSCTPVAIRRSMPMPGSSRPSS